MEREPFIAESLVKRIKTRQGWVYNLRTPKGPPPPEDPRLNELFYIAAQHFDFSPLFTGDQVQVRQVATDFMEHVYGLAEDIGIDRPMLDRRLKELSPHWRTALMVFRQTIDARVKGG